ncbi:hypothetical protein GQ55_5G488400 [Panicum hallii var. hallii]|uniref:Uncharacterized protein n=1 Tax=Panicum hallii var. hallii TaxID=1504633 RepID=A0A2T7DRH2_9POAL|nr:hypothetical protein GQ55_5G488400 [Panicum hallii var. hallii]
MMLSVSSASPLWKIEEQLFISFCLPDLWATVRFSTAASGPPPERRNPHLPTDRVTGESRSSPSHHFFPIPPKFQSPPT